MSTLATYSQHWSANGRYSRSQEAEWNHGAASRDFERARRRGAWRRLRARFTRRPVQLQHYHTTKRQNAKPVQGIQYIALDRVVGSEGRSRDFDDQFWPMTEHSRDRWVRIAMAMGAGEPLPPIQLIRAANGYVVRDGHHRLSVARAFGLKVIEAEVI
ncbi:MAG: hypothetical protein PVH65_05580 [Chloroflexota bacterium]|jgi:hypothetical protein